MLKSCQLFIVIGGFFLSDGPGFVAQDLQSELHTLNTMRTKRKGTATDLDAVDRGGAELLQKYPDPKDQGQIYYTLADVHAQSGMTHPERVAEYARKALGYPQDPGQRERLYVYWGDALQLANPKEPFQDRRRSAVQPYLEGLKALLEYDLPDKPPEAPAVNRFEADPRSGPVYEALKRQHDQEWAARKQADFQRDMIKHRDVLIGQIAGLYGRKPYAGDEIEDLAHRKLDNPALVVKLMESVNAEVKADMERSPPEKPAPPPPSGVTAPWLRWSLTLGPIAIGFVAFGVFLFLRRRKRLGSVGK